MKYHDILRKYWHYDDFRGIQLDIIKSIGEGHDTLGLMPTGGGKSITFQVPALAMEGVCIVITPLIALMKDQVDNLRKRGIRAAAIYTGISRDNIIAILENCIFGAYRLLYVSPERLSSDIFLKKICHAKVSFITVDEAHCITQWGYDFRPSYLNIAKFRQLFPDAPVLALTATATPDVVDDIQRQLSFRKKKVFRMSFLRPNLTYMVYRPVNRMNDIVKLLKGMDGSAIVYVSTRKNAKEVSEHLNKNGISATFYHAGLDSIDKNKRQTEWKRGNIRTMVATNAFGMGIDKPDVRLVIHHECPTSIEAYFQEAGRAGRDGEKSYSILLFDNHDKTRLQKKLQNSFPDKEYIRKVYDDIAYYFQIAVGDGFNCRFEFNIQQFCFNFHHYPVQVIAAISILEQAGYLEYSEDDDNMSRVKFRLQRDELYRLRNNSPKEDLLVEKLLRTYGGLFVDYMFIDETFLAEQLGMERNMVYFLLKELSHKNILNYIPRKSIPHIRYTQRREDSSRIIIPTSVYETRLKKAIERTKAVIAYAEDNGTCRSKLLLKYFGETVNKNCQMCDVCLSNKPKAQNEQWLETFTHVREFLKDKKPLPIEQLTELGIEPTLLADVITYMTNEGIITCTDGCVILEP
ncbi:MAG: ATP-dependent DNA helicase RecQ [Prevotella sp.]